MRKPIAIALSALLAVSAIPLASCKNSANENNPPAEITATPTAEVTVEPTAAPTDEPTPEATEAAELTDAELEAKVKEYCNLARPAVEAQKEVFDNLGMSAEIKAEGFDCITEYTYKEQMEVDTDALNRQLEFSWSTYKAMYDELHAYTGSDRVRVVLRYINADGTKILTISWIRPITRNNCTALQNGSRFRAAPLLIGSFKIMQKGKTC